MTDQHIGKDPITGRPVAQQFRLDNGQEPYPADTHPAELALAKTKYEYGKASKVLAFVQRELYEYELAHPREHTPELAAIKQAEATASERFMDAQSEYWKAEKAFLKPFTDRTARDLIARAEASIGDEAHE